MEAKLVVARDQESASSRLKLENLINKLEENRKRSRTRAELIENMSLDEIGKAAEVSLKYIEQIESGKVDSERKRLFYLSAGDRQSLLYKQIWSPFTDDQHGENI